MEARDLLIGHMEDLADKAIKTGCAASRFLTPAEAQSITIYFSPRREVTLLFDGGFEGAERVRAVFLNPDWGTCNREEMFAALKVSYRPQDTLGHRDVLGALMALGIERGTIGDISVNDPAATIVCLPEIGGYIEENLTKVGRVGVTVAKVSLDGISVITENLTIKTDTVASLRLDAVLCAAFGLSRSRAAELIEEGRVSLDHEFCIHPAKEVSEGSVLSVRGMGRAKVVELCGVSRKGRTFVKIGLYGR